MEKLHKLKCWPEYFVEVLIGRKTFEIRKNDRDFKQGDILFLQEWNPLIGAYTGRSITKLAGFIMYSDNKDFGSVADGYCCISLLPMSGDDDQEVT